MRPIVTDQVAWSVSQSVWDSSEPCKNGWTDRNSVWDLDSGGPKKALSGAVHLVPLSEYQWTNHVQRRCGLLSNYFYHLFISSLSNEAQMELQHIKGIADITLSHEIW